MYGLTYPCNWLKMPDDIYIFSTFQIQKYLTNPYSKNDVTTNRLDIDNEKKKQVFNNKLEEKWNKEIERRNMKKHSKMLVFNHQSARTQLPWNISAYMIYGLANSQIVCDSINADIMNWI